MKSLVTTYTHSDLDGYSCAVAYTEFLQKNGTLAQVGIFGTLHDETQFIINLFNLSTAPTISSANGYNHIVLVDCSSTAGLDTSIDADKVIEVIDHRTVNDSDRFANARLQIEPVGSAATLIAEKFAQTNTNISAQSAMLLCAAIISNTLNFQATVTTDRDREMHQWLKRYANIPDDLPHQMFVAKSDLTSYKLQQRMKSDFAWFDINGKRESIIQLEIVGTEALAKARKAEIIAEMNQWQDELKLDIIFTSLVDLERKHTIFIVTDHYSQDLLESMFPEITFQDGVAIRPGLLMRKQITPLIKQSLQES